MKRRFILGVAMLWCAASIGQSYPDPEFTNEIYFLNKGNGYILVRLEKESSKMDTKTKMGGFGGSESGYSMDGAKSAVRFTGDSNLSFIFSIGGTSSSSAKSDSVLKANGVDPAMMNGMMDPSNRITLYRAESEKGARKILLQKAPGANPFGSHKLQSSDKYTFSLKKIREGYWELVVDKPLAKGEYAFTMMNMGMQAMDGSMLLFAFGID